MRKYIPGNIDLDRLIKEHPVSEIKGFHPDYLKWILSEIAEKPSNYKGYAEIHSKRFRRFVHNYNAYLEYAERMSLIERDMQFYYDVFNNSKVRGYKFTEECSSTLTGSEINYLPLVKKEAREKEQKLKTCKGNSHLMKWFNPNLTVDYDSATSYLAVYYLEKKKEQKLMAEREKIIKSTWYEDYSEKCLTLRQCECKNPYESYRRAFISIDRIKEGDYQLSTDPTVRRFHSVLTLMPSDFRNFLRYDGKELVCLDIRNSQAYFSLNLLKEENLEEIINVAEELNKRDGKLCYNNSKSPSNLPSSSFILSESLQQIDNQEIERYKKLILSGKVYEYFEKAIKEELGIIYPSRKALKQEFFRVLYLSNRFLGQPGAAPKRVFQKLFPGIFEYFSQLKKLHPDLIPIVLMRWESHAVLQCITKRISRDHPDVPLFTIHDGIATTKENVDLVSSIICEELKALTGYSPKLKYEVWNKKNLKYYNKWNNNQT